MKNVLVLGAGLVASPLVRYLLEQARVNVTIATRTVSKAEKLINGHSRGRAYSLNVENQPELEELIKSADVVISLLPWTHHMQVARLCLKFVRHLVTTSYVKPEMSALNDQVKQKGLLFLNEIGVDPGIDHMAAMKIINQVKEDGGEIESFYSYCGGLPSLQSNTNPLGYKFSWSPVGVMLAALNNGCYLIDGNLVEVKEEQLFEHYWLLDVPGSGTYEAYVNRDALPYKKLYGIESALSLYRGTLRNVGHCESWNYFKKIGLFRQDLQFDFEQLTVAQVIAQLVSGTEKTLTKDVAGYLKIQPYSITIKKLEWLGLFSDHKVPLKMSSPFDMFAFILQQKLVYTPGETDLLLQHHEFITTYPGGCREKITSTMVDSGIPNGDSSMARTVSLPAAIATRLILENKINLTGVHIPVYPQIYLPVLEELERMNIKLVDRKISIT